MNMKRNTVLTAMLGAALLFNACSKQETVAPARSATANRTGALATPADSSCNPQVTPLLAGQHTEMGDVVVWNDSVNVYVTYTTYGGWQLVETQLYAGPLSGIPATSKGNPKVGNFPYKMQLDSGTTSYTFTIPVSDLGGEQCVAIASHAAVIEVGADGEVLQGQTAWGAGTRLTSKGNWATYFTYCLCNQGGTAGGGGSEGN